LGVWRGEPDRELRLVTDRIDIHDPIWELCDRLGLEPESVAQIIFKPDRVIAKVFLRNEHGSIYLRETDEGRAAASEIHEFLVRT
jgi:hypothetical protein